MYPTLVSFGPIRLSTFLVMVGLSLLFGLFVLWKRGRELYFEEDQLFDSIWMLLIVFLVGARIGYIITHNSQMGFNVISWINVFGRPGFIYITGFLALLGAVYIKARRVRFDMYTFGDVLAVAWTMVLSLISLGLFFSGSGSGKATSSFIGVQFAGMYEKRIPVQLFSFILYLGLFFLLWWLENRYRTISWYKGSKSEAHSGFIVGVFLVAHGLIELFLTPLRPGKLVYWVNFDYLVFFGIALLGGLILYSRSDLDWFSTGRQRRRLRTGRRINRVL
jgi:prolipoprotein diacylglyceryltransferase